MILLLAIITPPVFAAPPIPCPAAHFLYHGFLTFDTTAISGTITSATLGLKTYDDLSITDFNIMVYSGNGTTCWGNNNLQTNDWNSCYNNGTYDGDLMDTANYPGDYQFATMNIEPSVINKDGNTQFELISNKDLEAIEPPGYEYVLFYSANSDTNVPYLEITTLPDNTAPDCNILSVGGFSDSLPLQFSDERDGNLTVRFFVHDSDSDDLNFNMWYGGSQSAKTTEVVGDLNLSSAVCDSDINGVEGTYCEWDVETASVSDGNIFVTIEVNDGTVSDTNSTEFTSGILIDNTAPTLSEKYPSANTSDSDTTPLFWIKITDASAGPKGCYYTIHATDTNTSLQWADVNADNYCEYTQNPPLSHTETAMIEWRGTDNLDNNSTDQNTATYTCNNPPLEGPGQAYCGDRECNGRETASTCALDCPPVCGDKACTGNESFLTCPIDCFGCGDGTCSTTETALTCPQDCKPTCGDRTCAAEENCLTCPTDCGQCLEETTIFEKTIENQATEMQIEELTEQTGKSKQDTIEAFKKLLLKRKIKVTKAQTTPTQTTYKTTITISTKNTTTKTLKNVKILENIPKTIAETASQIKSNQEFKVIQEDPIIEFTIPNINTEQTAEITYFIEKKIEQATLTEWTPPIPTAATEIIPRPTTCLIDADCDDQEPCTNQQCINGECSFIPLPDRTNCGFGMECENAECTEIEKVQTAEKQDFTTIYIAIAILLIIGAAAWHYKKM